LLDSALSVARTCRESLASLTDGSRSRAAQLEDPPSRGKYFSVLEIADHVVPDPFAVLRTYASRRRTLQTYDVPGAGDPRSLVMEEITRTRVISSRISVREANWFLKRAIDAPWDHVPHDADLREADPAERGGLYDGIETLYRHFRADSPRGIAGAKVSKVLHLKRPAVYPILDSHLLKTYAVPARREGRAHPTRGSRHLYWAAIREDLIHNSAALATVRQQLSQDTDPNVQECAKLTDLRLMDICTW